MLGLQMFVFKYILKVNYFNHLMSDCMLDRHAMRGENIDVTALGAGV
jgi:hypothetical protein